MPAPRVLKDKKCPGCKEMFRPKYALVKFCSYNCAAANRPKKGLMITCKECHKEFYKSQYYANGIRKFCSLDCHNKNQTKRPESKICKHCGGIYWPSGKYKANIIEQKYCCVDCYRDARVREPKKVGNRRTGLTARVKTMAQKYARLRDCGGYEGSAICISCGTLKPYKELDGGHFIPSTCSATRFDERNINAQCHKCNRFLHGNQRHYAKGMLTKYGQEAIDELEAIEFSIKKWTYDELSELYDYYVDKLKEWG